MGAVGFKGVAPMLMLSCLLIGMVQSVAACVVLKHPTSKQGDRGLVAIPRAQLVVEVLYDSQSQHYSGKNKTYWKHSPGHNNDVLVRISTYIALIVDS
jgi:hypothetical protein